MYIPYIILIHKDKLLQKYKFCHKPNITTQQCYTERITIITIEETCKEGN